jgi:molybdenum cofactor cytidylyltransferase
LDNRQKTACIVLAAGSSVRFGSPKQLAEFQGKSLIQIAIDVANASKADYVFLVLGNSSSEILGNLQLGRAQLVFNKNFQQGISTSIKSGVANLPDDSEGVIVMVADQPYLTPHYLDLLIERFLQSPGKIVALSSNGEARNPVIIPHSMFGALQELEGDEGARALVKNNSKTILLEVSDPKVFVDVDTKASLLKLENES